MSPKLLEAKNIHKLFLRSGGVWSQLFDVKHRNREYIKAVDDVSFDIRHGEILGILGQSGSGKTTLVRTLMHLDLPTSGQALFMGNDIFTMPKDEINTKIRRKMRMVFQHPDAVLNPAYKVEMVLKQALEMHRQLTEIERDEQINELLNSVGMSPSYYRAKYPHELSGGEKRRIGICRALATQPHLVFADEPVSGLDMTLQSQILDLILEARERHDLAIVFISHDIAIVRIMCDRIGVMYAGRLIELGKKEDVSSQSCLHPYTQQLYDSQISIQSDIKNQRAFDKVKYEMNGAGKQKNDQSGCSYRSHCSLWHKEGKPDICINEVPPLEEKNNNHFTACHFVK